MNHPTTLQNYSGTLENLAKELGNLRYDSLATFLKALSNDLYSQAQADERRGRPLLAAQGYLASSHLEQAAESAEKVWKISQPYMKKEGE